MKRGLLIIMLVMASGFAHAENVRAEITEISLRNSIWGEHPDYDVLLCSDGLALYYGKDKVEKLGTYRGVIRADIFEGLAAQLADHGFFSLKRDYTAGAKDPSCFSIAAVRGEMVKSVKADFERGTLDEFKSAIEAAIGQIQWKKYEGPEEPSLELLAEKLRGGTKPLKPVKKSPIAEKKL